MSKYLPTDIWKYKIIPFVSGNCESITNKGTKCLEPWQFKMEDKTGSCHKYCVIHCNKWVDKLFENPYTVSGIDKLTDEKTTIEPVLIYEIVVDIPLEIAKDIIDKKIQYGYNHDITITIDNNKLSWIIYYDSVKERKTKQIDNIDEFKTFLCTVLKYNVKLIRKVLLPNEQYPYLTDRYKDIKVMNKDINTESLNWKTGGFLQFINPQTNIYRRSIYKIIYTTD